MKKFQEISKKNLQIGSYIYFDILWHNCVQKSFTSVACPGTHTGQFFFIEALNLSKITPRLNSGHMYSSGFEYIMHIKIKQI